MATWPADLPQVFALEGSVEEYAEGRVRFDTDTGPAKMARISTADPIRHAFTMVMSESQKDVLEDFWDTTLGGGVDDFDWTNPWPGAGAKTFRFLRHPGPYQWLTPAIDIPDAYHAGATSNPQRLCRVQIQLEELPWFPP